MYEAKMHSTPDFKAGPGLGMCVALEKTLVDGALVVLEKALDNAALQVEGARVALEKALVEGALVVLEAALQVEGARAALATKTLQAD